MQRLSEVVGAHWGLFLALAIITILLAVVELRRRAQAGIALSAVAATQLINRENALMLDVREEGEYRAGHVLNAVHIPLKVLTSKAKELEKYKGRPVIAYCRTGQQSAQAGRTLKTLGIERAYHLSGGLLAWQNASLPVSKR